MNAALGVTDQTIEIFPATKAGAGLEVELRDWFEAEFGRADQWKAPDYYATSRVENRLAGRLGILDRHVSVGGAIIRVGGIGGVVTKREFRHQGVASTLLSRAARFMKNDLSLEFGLLLCRHEVSPVYAKLGWMPVLGPTAFSRAGATATYPHDTMILPFTDKPWPPGPIDMLGLPW